MGTTPFTLKNHSTCSWLQQIHRDKFFQTGYDVWIRRVIAIAVLWLSKAYGYNFIHLKLENHSSYSWLQQILITETNSSKLNVTCIIVQLAAQILTMETVSFFQIIAVLGFSKVYGCN